MARRMAAGRFSGFTVMVALAPDMPPPPEAPPRPPPPPRPPKPPPPPPPLTCMRAFSFSISSWICWRFLVLVPLINRLAAQVVAVGAVADHAAGQGGHPEVAQILSARGAPVADAARGDEGHGPVGPPPH